MIDFIAKAGGLFAVFVFVHFVIDWVFQTHHEAMNKPFNHWIRARHCLVYTSPFVVLLWWFGVAWPIVTICSAVLFLSHFVEDTYLPVYLWAKHIRRVPRVDSREGFHHWITYEPLGKILMIAIDQIIHLLFLWIPVCAVLLT